jgi:DNA polymerase V
MCKASKWQDIGITIRKAVWREVRLPICVGIGACPTLAKAANHAAKKIAGYNEQGVVSITNDRMRKDILSKMATSDVWGIGKKLSQRLATMGITTALQLANSNPQHIRKSFSILVENTVRELNGEHRLSWDECRAAKKEIYSSRSFGECITTEAGLLRTFTFHSEIVAKKLRKQKSLAKGLLVFAASSPFDTTHHISRSVHIRFAAPTSDTRILLRASNDALSQLFVPGTRYKRSGIGAVDLQDEAFFQGDLFSQSGDNKDLMSCLDGINARFGSDTLHLASKGFTPAFSMRQAFLSPQYTTRWSDIPKINC